MIEGKSHQRHRGKSKLSPHTTSFLIALSVFLGLVVVRQAGGLQFPEFYAYDFLVQRQPKADTTDPIVLVEMTEADIHSPSLDYPVHDDKLAELLRNLLAAGPVVIGLDIWRDIPVPKKGTGIEAFNEVLLYNSNVVAIFTLGGISAPAALRTNYDRIAFNDNFPVDVEVDHTIPRVRRTMLFAESRSGQTLDSLPFRLALLYLESRGIVPEPDPTDPNAFRLGKAQLRPFKANDGAYVGTDTGGWQMLLDFKCPEKFTRYSFNQVLAGQIPPESLRDKIVLVGMNSASVLDERVTPVRRNHRGIELQSQAVNQILRLALDGEEPLRWWSDGAETAWIFVWCMAGGAIAYRVRSPWHLVLTTSACMVTLAGIAWVAFENRLWIPIISPAAAFVPATALVLTYISSYEASMRNILMKLYSRHVSREIAESMWENRDAFLDGRRPRAQKIVVTVLFTDLKGFSTISEKLEPARLFEWLNDYLGSLAEMIQTHGGVLKQFTGDGVLALFGVPVPHTTQAEQSADASAAVECALAMGNRLVQLTKEWQAAGLPLVSMRAGIYTGEVAAGSIGSDERFEYSVIGDVVNTASRLESYDKNFADPDLLPNRCRILIGEPTHTLLGPGFVSREIGLLEVKGKANKVPVFQILGKATASPTAPGAICTPETKLMAVSTGQTKPRARRESPVNRDC